MRTGCRNCTPGCGSPARRPASAARTAHPAFIFLFVEGDIGNTLVVQAHDAQLQQELNNGGSAVGKLLAVGAERNKHPEGHGVVDHQTCADPQDGYLVTGHNKSIHPAEHQVHLGQADAGIDGIDFQIQPVIPRDRSCPGFSPW